MEQAPSVIANCKIINRIGQGGMGSVYRAVHQHLGRNIALKLLPAEFTRSEEYVTRFLREARAVANLSHPNVVTVHDAGEQDGQYYIAMELIEGGSLGVLMRKRGKVPEKAALDFLAQAGKGLAAAHDRGLIHRDIKPENMLVNKDGILKIVDFGLVLESTAQSHLTKTGTFLGTPVYMSPEQCDGAIADARSDLYSLGASFYTLLTGKPPFNAPTALGILYKHKFEAPPDPREADPTITEKCSQVLLKLMAKKREERYQSAKELVKDAEAALKTAPETPEDWSFDGIMGEILASMPEAPSLTASPLTPGAMPTLTPGRSSPLSRTPATVANSSPPTLSGTPTGTPFPGSTGPLMPTLLTPGAGRTPGPHSTPGMEPTLVQPASGRGGATPLPGPLAEMYTPTQAVQAKKRAGWVWPAVAAAALLAVGLGGYFGYGAYQQSKFAGYLKDFDAHADKGDSRGADYALRAARGIFPDSQEVQDRADRLSLLEKKDQQQQFTQFAQRNQKTAEYNTLVGNAEDLIKKGELGQAKSELQKATQLIPVLQSLGQEPSALAKSAKEMLALVENKLLRKDAEDLAAKGNLEEAAKKFMLLSQQAAKPEEREEAKQKASNLYFQYLSKMSEDEEGKGELDKAITFADDACAWDREKGEPRLQRLKQIQSENRTIQEAEKEAKEGRFQLAEDTIRQSLVALGKDDDPKRREKLVAMANGYRLKRLLKAVADAKAKGDPNAEMTALDEALKMHPPEEKELIERKNSLVAAAKAEGTAKENRQKADAAYDTSSWSEALNFYKAVQLADDSPEVRSRIAVCDARLKLNVGIEKANGKHWTPAKESFEDAAKQIAGAPDPALVEDLKGKVDERLKAVLAKIKEIESLANQAEADAGAPESLAKAIVAYQKLKDEDPDMAGSYDQKLPPLQAKLQHQTLLQETVDLLKAKQWGNAREKLAEALKVNRNDTVADARRQIADQAEQADQFERNKDWKGAADAYTRALSYWPAANLASLAALKTELDGKKTAAAGKAASIGKLAADLATAKKSSDLVGQMRTYKDLFAEDLPEKTNAEYTKANTEVLGKYKAYAEKVTGERKVKEAKDAWTTLIQYDPANKAAYDEKLSALASIKSEAEMVAEAVKKAQGLVGQGKLEDARQALGGDVQVYYGSNADIKEATAALSAMSRAEKDLDAAQTNLRNGIAAIKADWEKIPTEKSQLDALLTDLERPSKPWVQDFLGGKFKNAAGSASSAGTTALSRVRSALDAAALAIKNKTKVTVPEVKTTTPEVPKTRKRHDNAGEE